MTMKETIVNGVDNYFVYNDVASLMPNKDKQSIMGRIHELIEDGSITRIRRAAHNGRKVAIYQKN